MEGQQMPPQGVPPVASQSPLNDEQDIRDNKIWAFVGYVGIFSLLPLFMKKESKFAQFHAKQGLVLFLISVITRLVDMGVLSLLISFALAIVWLIAVIKVWQNKYWKIPVIGDFAEKIKI